MTTHTRTHTHTHTHTRARSLTYALTHALTISTRTLMQGMDPLFSAYGWTDDEFGFVWMTTSSGAAPDGTPNAAARGGGGAVFCR